MSHKNKGRYGKETIKGQFVCLPFNFLDSLAYKYLSNAAVCAFIQIKRRFNGANNGDITVSCRQIASVCQMSRNTASRALAELQAKGIIKKTHQGIFGMRIASKWKLNTDKNVGENRPSDEWKAWRPGQDFTDLI